MSKDLYETLGVNKDATPEEIKKTFRDKSKTAHPDKGGSTEEYQQLAHAYDILKDAKKRQRYDTTGDDSDPEVKRRNSAVSEIIKLFQGLVQEHIEHAEEVNYIKKVEEALKSKKERIKGIRKQLKKELKGIGKVMKRLKYKGKDLDFIAMSLEQLEMTHKKGLLDIQEELEINYISLKLIKNYEFDAEIASSVTVHGLSGFMGAQPNFAIFDDINWGGTTS